MGSILTALIALRIRCYYARTTRVRVAVAQS
jgi:hypothetical protein